MFAIDSFRNVCSTENNASATRAAANTKANAKPSSKTHIAMDHADAITVNQSTIAGDLQAAANKAPAATQLQNTDAQQTKVDKAPLLKRTFKLSRSVTEHDVKQYQKETKYANRDLRTGKYNPIDNVIPPLTDRFNTPLEITAISARGVATETDKRYGSELIVDYLKKTDPHTKAKLYESKIAYKIFRAKHMQCEGEAALINQGMVVARRDLAAGECIGIYTGQIMPVEYANPLDPFCMDMTSAEHGAPKMIVSGRNLLSKVNSKFEFDARGYPIKEADSGYNLEAVLYTIHAKLPGKPEQKYLLKAFFTTEGVRKGKEVRFPYGYDATTLSQIVEKMRIQESQHSTSSAVETS